MEKNSIFQGKNIKRIIIFFMIAAGFLVAFKMTFWAYSIDESFHVTMSYRKAIGERVFGEMWEVYATSSFLCAFLEKIYIAINGSAVGMVIFLKACGVIIQLIVSTVLYRTSKRIIPSFQALIISFSFFVMYPKMTSIPDFSNMQQWSMVLMFCALYMSWESEWRKKGYIVLAALFYSISILAYPAQLILIPVLFAGFFFVGQNRKLQVQLSFWCTCFVSGTAFLLYLQFTTGLKTVLTNFADIVSGDGTHLTGENIIGENILVSTLGDIRTIFVYACVSTAIALVVFLVFRLTVFKKCDKVFNALCAFTLIVIASFLPSIVKWARGDSYDTVKIYHIVTIFVALVATAMTKNVNSAKKRWMIFVLLLGLGMLVAVSLVSNVPLSMNVIYLQSAYVLALLVIAFLFKDKETVVSILLLTALVINVFSSVFTVRASVYGSNILSYRRQIQTGIAKGVYVNTDQAWLFERESEEFVSNVASGESVLIVANSLNIPTSTMYMLQNVTISNYSTNSTPVYNEELLSYWAKYPEREPDVIAVDKSYGTIMNFNEDGWMHNYVDDFYYLSSSGDYMDFYRRK